MEQIVIPVGEPLTFDRLRDLNPRASAQELADAFPHLPAELREQAWDALRLRAALEDWNAEATT
jgi:hypothetical protein